MFHYAIDDGAGVHVASQGTWDQAEILREAVRIPSDEYGDRQACGLAKQRPEVELSGAVVHLGVEGTPEGRGIKAESAAECCRVCRATPDCNVWVFCSVPERCGTECCLKHVDRPEHITVQSSGSNTPWTSGVVEKDYVEKKNDEPPGR